MTMAEEVELDSFLSNEPQMDVENPPQDVPLDSSPFSTALSASDLATHWFEEGNFLKEKRRVQANLFNVKLQDLKLYGVILKPIESFQVFIFVSHLWENQSKPDIRNSQIQRIFQILRGFYQRNESYFNRLTLVKPDGRYTLKDWALKSTNVKEFLEGIGIWYDYVCLPQNLSEIEERELQATEASRFGRYFRLANVLILDENVLGQEGKLYWERGWCVLEYVLASNLSICYFKESSQSRDDLRLLDFDRSRSFQRTLFLQLLGRGKLSTSERKDLLRIDLLAKRVLKSNVFLFPLWVILFGTTEIVQFMIGEWNLAIKSLQLAFLALFLVECVLGGYFPRSLRFRTSLEPLEHYSPSLWIGNTFTKLGFACCGKISRFVVILFVFLSLSTVFLFFFYQLLDYRTLHHDFRSVGYKVGYFVMSVICGVSMYRYLISLRTSSTKPIKTLTTSRSKLFVSLFHLKIFLLFLFSIRNASSFTSLSSSSSFSFSLSSLSTTVHSKFDQQDEENLKQIFKHLSASSTTSTPASSTHTSPSSSMSSLSSYLSSRSSTFALSSESVIGRQELNDLFSKLRIDFKQHELDLILEQLKPETPSEQVRFTFEEYKMLFNLPKIIILSDHGREEFQEFLNDQMFNIFDRKTEGRIEVEDMNEVLSVFGFELKEEQSEKLLAEADRNEEEKLDFDDFRILLKKYLLWDS